MLIMNDGWGKFIFYLLLFVTFFIIAKCSESQAGMMKSARDGGRVSSYLNYLEKYEDGRFVDEAIDSIGTIAQRETVFDIIALSDFHAGIHIDSRIDSIVCMLSAREYEKALKENSEYGWLKFKESVPEKYWRDADDKLSEIYHQLWGTEYRAWKSATTENSVASYSKYLDLYPKGAHARRAEKKLVDMSVRDIFGANAYGELPPMNKTYSSTSSTSKISVNNDTGYVLTLMYSGPDSRRMIISPHTRKSITLINGTYRIAASVNASDVSPFAGTETITGGGYDVSYYISTRY